MPRGTFARLISDAVVTQTDEVTRVDHRVPHLMHMTTEASADGGFEATLEQPEDHAVTLG